MSVSFLLNVDRGALDAQALLCVESLRQWGGELSSAPVYTFAPRPGHDPAPETLGELERLGAQHVQAPTNPHPDRPMCNKVYAGAWAEENLDDDFLVYVDSDTFFLREPSLLAAGDWDAAVLPVGQTNAGSTGPGHPNEPFWEDLYRHLGVSSRPWVETIVGRERIRAYFNGGLVALRRTAGIFASWRDNLELILEGLLAEAHERPGKSLLRNQVDQLALAGTLADRHERTQLLPNTYNYPLPKRILHPPEMQELGIDDLVHVHGHRWLHLPGFLHEVHPPLDQESERFKWLEARLPLEPTIDEPFRFPAPSKGA